MTFINVSMIMYNKDLEKIGIDANEQEDMILNNCYVNIEEIEYIRPDYENENYSVIGMKSGESFFIVYDCEKFVKKYLDNIYDFKILKN